MSGLAPGPIDPCSPESAVWAKRRAGDDEEARAARYRGADLDAVSEQLHRPPDHEQADAEAIAAGRVEALKRLEDVWQVLRRDADAGVVDVDPHVASRPAASDQNASARLRV